MKLYQSENGSAPLFMIFGLGTLFVLAGVFYYVMTKNFDAQPASTFQTVPTFSPSSVLDWKVYHNTEAKFSINYPPTWTLKVVRERPTAKDDLALISLEGAEGTVLLNWGSGFGGACEPDFMEDLKILNETLRACHEVDRDGKHTWRMIYKTLSATTGFAAFAKTNTAREADRNTIVKIFSTLQFTDAPRTVNTTNWQPYNNLKYGYIVKYPQNWKLANEIHDTSGAVLYTTKINASQTNDIPNVRIMITPKDSMTKGKEKFLLGHVTGSRTVTESPKGIFHDTVLVTRGDFDYTVELEYGEADKANYLPLYEGLLASFSFTR